MEYATIAGNYYTITSKSGCTVTDSTGTLEETVEAGKQLTVQAPSDKLIYDDAQAIVFKSNFSFALARRGGEGTKLPDGYIQASFLESTGEQYIDTAYKLSNADDIELVVAEVERPQFWGCAFGTLYDSGSSYYLQLKYYNEDTRLIAKCGTGSKYGTWTDLATEPSAKNTFTCKARQWACNGKKFGTKDSNSFSLSNPASLFALNNKGNAGWTPSKLRVFSFRIQREGMDFMTLLPALSPTGEPCLYDKVSKRSFTRQGSGYFRLGMTLAMARTLGMTLPDGGGTLYISLPEGWQTDSKTHASLSLAGARQWNIYPSTYTLTASTSTTFALRRVWVRKIADELGSYVAADGSRWRVEWCEEVFSSATPEELGFERFRSVDAAAEYWGLVPYVAPEEELSTIE